MPEWRPLKEIRTRQDILPNVLTYRLYCDYPSNQITFLKTYLNLKKTLVGLIFETKKNITTQQILLKYPLGV